LTDKPKRKKEGGKITPINKRDRRWGDFRKEQTYQRRGLGEEKARFEKKKKTAGETRAEDFHFLKQ